MAFSDSIDPYAAFLAWFQIALLLWLAAGQLGLPLQDQLLSGLAALFVGVAHLFYPQAEDDAPD